MQCKQLYSLLICITLTTSFNAIVGMDITAHEGHARTSQKTFADPKAQKEAFATKKKALLQHTVLYGVASGGAAGLSITGLGVTAFTAILNNGEVNGTVTKLLIASATLALLSAYCFYKCIATGVKCYSLTQENVFGDKKRTLISQLIALKKITLSKALDLQLSSVINHN